MADLTELYKTTKYLIDSGDVVCEHRPYLGMSQLGHECSRYLWYGFHWAYEERISKRVKRLFQVGHDYEPTVYKLLENLGYEVSDSQLDFGYCFGHVRGHIDGTVKGVVEAPKTTHLLEIKTMNDSSFKSCIKKGVQKDKPVYYAQMQLYMYFGKFTRALFFAYNKNDSSIHIERIHFDKACTEDLLRKADSILMSAYPPPRAFSTKTFYMCKWCSARDVCWNEAPMEKNCRTCKHSGPAHEGKWECELYNGIIPLDFQRIGCDAYQELEHEV